MVKFKAAHWILISAAAIAVALVAVSYGTPYLRTDDCRELAIRHLLQNPVRGQDMDQKWTSAKPSDVWVYVTGPFASEARYIVPNDLHAIVYTHECKSNIFSVSLGPRKRFFTL